MTTIQEAKDLNNFRLEELIGLLMTYEMTCMIHDKLKNNLLKNMKNIVLRTEEDRLSQSSSDDEDLTLLTRKFKKFIRRNEINLVK